MDTHNESAPPQEVQDYARAPFDQRRAAPVLPVQPVDPNNPPWGIPTGVLVWVASVALLLLMGILFLIPYVFANVRGTEEEIRQFLSTDKTALLLQILSAIPAHLFTFGIIWAVVTRFGKRPFWETIGWSWGKGVGFWKSAGLAVLLLALGIAITSIFKGQPTDIDNIVNSSAASRYIVAFLAGVSAPFIEELTYRGVLYPALQRPLGAGWAIAIVSFLFALVHAFQYRNNIAVIAVVSLLSLTLTLLRAYTGKLLPCFIVHLVYNGIQAIYIVVQPYLPQAAPDVEQKAPAAAMLWRSARPLFF